MHGIELDQAFDWHGATVRWTRLGSGRPVVFCHGTPWSSFVWRDVVGAIRDRRSVYLWDMVGYGRSDKPDGDVSLAAQGELLAALAAHWELDHPDVVAHDYGGAVALRAHLLHAMTVGSLTLIDAVILRPWGSPFFRLVSQHAEVFAALPPNLHEALLREYVSGASSPGLRPQVLDALVAPWRGAGQSAFYRQIAQADERFTAELEPLLPGINVPTLIVWGTDDTWIPVDRAARLGATIPASRVELIEGAGHLVQEDQPERLTAVVSGWLDDR